MVAAKMHWLEGAKIMTAGGYWGDVVSGRTERVGELERLVDRQTAAGADEPVSG